MLSTVSQLGQFIHPSLWSDASGEIALISFASCTWLATASSSSVSAVLSSFLGVFSCEMDKKKGLLSCLQKCRDGAADLKGLSENVCACTRIWSTHARVNVSFRYSACLILQSSLEVLSVGTLCTPAINSRSKIHLSRAWFKHLMTTVTPVWWF